MRTAIGIAYSGAGLEGWQSQPSGNTVQDHIERAISEIAGERVDVTGAGRTDAGVHAVAQVAHFESEARRPETAWVRGANSLLPASVAIQWAMTIARDFHARFSVVSRSYRYVLYNHSVRPALLVKHAGWYHAPLNLESMRQAARHLIGEHDFSGFRSAECQAKSPVRVMERVDIHGRGPYLFFDFTANAFLHHMVRNLVGSLVYVGNGKHPPEWMAKLLEARDRKLAAPTFAAEGLYLSAVRYDARWKLPAFPRMMPFEAEHER